METTNLVNEVFIPITGYENEYEISNLGNVKRNESMKRLLS